MEPPALDSLSGILLITFHSPSSGTIVAIIIIVLLLLGSAMFSASEVAFFSLTPTDLDEIKNSKNPTHQRILYILEKPKRLLATILIGNNMVNVAIVILSATVIEGTMGFEDDPAWLEFLVQVVGVTFLILLFGEVMPKIYANRYSKAVAGLMGTPMLALRKILWPLSQLLISSSSVIDKRIKKKTSSMTVDELGHAFELTINGDQTSTEEKKILEGIVKFGNTDVKQIMKPRMDVIAFEIKTGFYELISKIIDSGFSRVPIYDETLDKIKGVLYIKDLLPFLQEEENFKWQSLMRPAFYVPENKKIDDLLKEFKDTKIHLAIVVDEYGGTQGIVTLEDVIEEIVGDITDEFDDEAITYTRIDDYNFVFEGKTQLVDIYKVLEIDGEEFEQVKGEYDTLAGFLLERSGKMPQRNDKIEFGSYTFLIEAVDKRRIKQVKVSIKKETNQNGAKSLLTVLVLALFLISCGGGETAIPKPRGFMRIDFPEKTYLEFSGDCPYTFEYPSYVQVENKGMRPEEYCFKDLHFTNFNGTLHLTYKKVDNNVDRFIEDCHNLVFEHSIKASAIENQQYVNDTTKVYGLLYDIKGNAASPLQFYVTDSTQHFIRGAVYFMAKPNYDSIRPVLDFVREDVIHFIETVKWK